MKVSVDERTSVNRRTIGILILSVLGLALAAWLGVGLYQAGYVQGAAAEGSEIVIGHGYPYPGPYGIGVIGIMFKAFFALLFFGLLAKLFFFRPWAHHHGHGPGRMGFGPGGPRHEEFRNRMEQHLTEWHDQAHAVPEQEPAEES
jgi:hypothetical protein